MKPNPIIIDRRSQIYKINNYNSDNDTNDDDDVII
jgi:hypothetical protein